MTGGWKTPGNVLNKLGLDDQGTHAILFLLSKQTGPGYRSISYSVAVVSSFKGEMRLEREA